jgi:endonuclease/exonuclease/phosphatase (EEP) superfamily protein YafD
MKKLLQGLVRLLRRFLFLINVATLVPLILATLVVYISPADWFWPSVFAMVKPYLLLIPLAWAIGWGIKRRWRFVLANLLLIAINYSTFGHFYQSNEALDRSRHDFRVLSYNVNAFQYEFGRFQQTLDYIKAQEPDILCLQEFFNAKDRKGRVEGRALKHLRAATALEHTTFVELLPQGNYGLLIMSRFPIMNAGAVTPTEGNRKNGVIFADLKLYGETMRVYNIHLASYNFSLGQRRMLANRKANYDTRSGWELLKVMIHTWHEQARQLNYLQQHRAGFEGPTLLCTDLNNPPYSYFYDQVRGPLYDTFELRGNGYGTTYPGYTGPLRIDYVFASEDFLVVDHQIHEHQQTSDHYPLLTKLRFGFHH